MTRKPFTFDIWYFKDSGKFYSSHKYKYECQAITTAVESPYMIEIIEHLKYLRDHDVPVPGLTSSWKDGYILVDHPQGYPCLIVPKKE